MKPKPYKDCCLPGQAFATPNFPTAPKTARGYFNNYLNNLTL